MSERTTVLAAFVYLREPAATNLEGVATLLGELAAIVGGQPRTMFVTSVGGRNTPYRKFSVDRAVELVRDDDRAGTITVSEVLKSDRRFRFSCYLREHPDFDPRAFSPPSTELVLGFEGSSPLQTARQFFRATATRFPVLHGGATLHAAADLAATESSLTLIDRQPDEFVARIGFDAMHCFELWTHIRRVYPVTLIGREVLEAVGGVGMLHDTGCEVEVVGEAALVTAVPELVGLDDPEFLRRARALRTLLWPHSIQYGPDEPTTDSPENDA